MRTKHARTIGAFRSSGQNPRPQHQQPASQPPERPSAPVTAPQRPQDAKTMQETLSGFAQAMSLHGVKLVKPRFRSTTGPWIRIGDEDIRIPADVIVRTSRQVAVLAYLDSSREAGRVQVLVVRPQGVREMIGLAPNQLTQLREVFLGR
ncbi:hypothetical protein [Microbacterium sp. NPDC079176]|uniref:hypothetical protein n=1 Tax=Microbacterium sp. NPDC079176 TaxID=3154768 RepID=UPI003436EA6F